jgi:tetratricopeptide (TPR) repeat protein
METAIDYLTKFLEICLETRNNEKLSLAYKRLSEVESKNGNTRKAIENLQKVIPLVNSQKTPNRKAWADATLGLGLLFNQDGKEHDIKLAH